MEIDILFSNVSILFSLGSSSGHFSQHPKQLLCVSPEVVAFPWFMITWFWCRVARFLLTMIAHSEVYWIIWCINERKSSWMLYKSQNLCEKMVHLEHSIFFFFFFGKEKYFSIVVSSYFRNIFVSAAQVFCYMQTETLLLYLLQTLPVFIAEVINEFYKLSGHESCLVLEQCLFQWK